MKIFGGDLLNEFLINFSANLLADAILAYVIYRIITQPTAKKKEDENFGQALALLRTEIKINSERANDYIIALDEPIKDINSLTPLRFSRGAWNALKESDFLPKLNNAELVYNLLRMNETALVANKNLRRLQLAYLEKTKVDKKQLAELAIKESKHLLDIFSHVASILDQMNLPSFAMVDPLNEDEIYEEDLYIGEDEG